MSIRNVEPGETLHDKDRLATKGVFTCVAVLIFLQDNTLFLAHVDSTIFDANTNNPLVEVQNIIEHGILMLDVNYKDIMIETVVVIGGVQNDEYEKLNNSLSTLRETPSIIIPKFKTVSLERLRMFIGKIKYHNLCMNFIENSISVDDITKSTWITDVSIVCDKTYTPPIIAISQYFGKECEMNGDKRAFGPTIIYMIDFLRDKPHVFICPNPVSSPFIIQVIDKIKTETDEKSPNRDFFGNLIKYVLDDLIPQIED